MSAQMDLFSAPEKDKHYIRRVGGEGVLLSEDLPALRSQRLRVALLMMDFRWHLRQEIEAVARGAEGLRRMRELRQRGWEIDRRRISGARVWQYRATYIPEADHRFLSEEL